MLDRGAIIAGMVGLGVAITVAISFGLIITLQLPVFIAAPICGVLIGYYANYKSERYRPRWRLFANATFAGAVTGISLALFYIGLRMLFWYGDFGFRPEGLGGQVECANGIECTYERMLEDESSSELLADAGVTDLASFESLLLRTSADWALILIVTTLGGSLVAAGWRAVKEPPDPGAPPKVVAAA